MTKYTKAQNKYLDKLYNFIADNCEMYGNSSIGIYDFGATADVYARVLKAKEKINTFYKKRGLPYSFKHKIYAI